MNKIVLLMILGITFLPACRSDQLIEKAQLKVNDIESLVKDKKLAVIIPNTGCSGCISTAESFLQLNSNNSNILFVLTKIVSKKHLRLKLGNLDILNAPNIILDDNNDFIFSTEESFYPIILYLKKGKVVKGDFQSPNSPKALEEALLSIND